MKPKKPITVSLDLATIGRIDRLSELLRVSRSAHVQMAISEFIDRHWHGVVDSQGVALNGEEG